VDIVYTPGHDGGGYNELDDTLAGDAVTLGYRDMTSAGVIASIIDTFRERERERDDNEDLTLSMSWLG
jgi:hypothetical protein